MRGLVGLAAALLAVAVTANPVPAHQDGRLTSIDVERAQAANGQFGKRAPPVPGAAMVTPYRRQSMHS
jgi:hypothetical protein